MDLQKFSDEFDQLMSSRHETGAEEYGPLAFLENNMFAYVYEELADASNYLRYQFIKLRVLEEKLHESGIDISHSSVGEVRMEDKLSHDTTAFSPHQEISGFFPEGKE